MKIVALHLKYYGPFTNKTLQFGEDSGLHIIFGPNESGKSTTLRALHHALFGFDSKAARRDAHVHDAKTLAVGISVRGVHGEQIDVVRSIGQGTKSLVYAQSGKSAPGLVLPVEDEDQFKMLFGIDYERLVSGGRMLADFKGDLGQAMLAAAGDTGEALKLISSLEDRCEVLYKERGSAPLLNKALSEYREAKRAINASRLSPAELKTLLNRLDQVRQDIEQTDAKLAAARLQRLNLDRLVNAVPHVRRLRENKRRLQELGEFPVLGADFKPRYATADEARRVAETQRRSAEVEQKRLQAELQALDRKPALAGIRESLDALTALSAKAVEALEDIPKREARKQEKENQKIALCQLLGIPADAVPTITLEEQTRIENLCTDHTVLETKRGQLPGRIGHVRDALKQEEHELAALPPSTDITALRKVLTDIPTARRSGEELRKLKAQHESESRTLQLELSALPLWMGGIEDLESAAIPLAAQIAGFEKRFASLEIAGRRVLDDQNRLNDEKSRLRVDLTNLEAARIIPTEKELEEARRKRDELWTHVRVAWQNGAWLSELADHYESALGHADRLADQLKTEADAVVKKAHLLARLDAIAKELATLDQRGTVLTAEQQKLEADWVGCWPVGRVTPGAPAEMREWCEHRKSILERQQSLRILEQNIAAGEAVETAWRSALASMLQQPSTAGLHELVAVAETRIQASEKVQNRRSELTGSINKVRRELNAALREESEIAREWQAWNSTWTGTVAKLPTRQTPDPALARRILGTIGQIKQLENEIAGLEYRITSMAQNGNAFATRLLAIAETIGQGCMVEANPQLAFETLRSLSDAASQTETTAQELNKSIGHHIRARETAGYRIEAQEETLRTLAAEAGLGDNTQAIGALLERYNQHLDLKQAVIQDEEALLPSCGTKPLESFLEKVELSDSDRLHGELEQLEVEVQELDKHAKDVREEHLTLRHEYDDHSQSEAVNAAASRRECAAAQIGEHANEYARSRITAHLLRKMIERYRDKHQDPLLQRVSDYFEMLTCGRYQRVRIAQTDSARFLLAIRSDYKEVTVDGLSDGARDQLFLALRLAHVANHCATAEPCPLILDDVLMAFDDERAAATMKALSEFAGHTQVLLFTHHKHHVELARETLGAGAFCLHELAT